MIDRVFGHFEASTDRFKCSFATWTNEKTNGATNWTMKATSSGNRIIILPAAIEDCSTVRRSRRSDLYPHAVSFQESQRRLQRYEVTANLPMDWFPKFYFTHTFELEVHHDGAAFSETEINRWKLWFWQHKWRETRKQNRVFLAACYVGLKALLQMLCLSLPHNSFLVINLQ